MKKIFFTLLLSFLMVCSANAATTINNATMQGAQIDDQRMNFWANCGADKVTQDEMRMTDGEDVTNNYWDGTTISLKGAKGEVVSYSLYIESTYQADNMTVEVSTLSGDTDITTESRSANNTLFDFTGRNIEIFYVRYLKVLGVQKLQPYRNGDERFYPLRMRRPSTLEGEDPYKKARANDGTTWFDRPNHDKYYPVILPPYELHTNFTIMPNNTQQIWVDIFIPKTTTAGTYTGTITVKEDGTTKGAIPVSLTVHNFTVPDQPSLISGTFYEEGYGKNWIQRVYGQPWYAYADQTDELQTELNLHWRNVAKLFWRHRMSLLQLGERVPDDYDDTDSWRDFGRILDGDLFTDTFDYEGPGYDTGVGVWVTGLYGGTWRGNWNVSDDQDATDKTNVCTNLDTIATAVDTFDATAKKIWFISDEPWTEETITFLNTYASWVEDCTGGGEDFKTQVTTDLVRLWEAGQDFSMGVDRHGYRLQSDYLGYDGMDTIVAGWLALDSRKELIKYSVPQVTTAEPRKIYSNAYEFFKHDITYNFVWQTNLWQNNEGGYGNADICGSTSFVGSGWAENTNIWGCASTLGPATPTESGTPPTYFDSIKGWVTHGNGRGVMVFPGKDFYYPNESYGLDGIIATVNMKLYRNNSFTYDYLTLADAEDSTATDAVVDAAVPYVTYERPCQVNDTYYGTWGYRCKFDNYTNMPSNDADDWADAKDDLADIILGN